MQILEPVYSLGEIVPNIAQMLKKSVQQFEHNIVFKEKKNGYYEGITWKDFYNNILNIAYNLKQYNFRHGDKIVL